MKSDMSLLQKIQQDSISAMKKGNSVKTDILKMVIASLKNAVIAKTGDSKISPEEEVKIVFSEAKKLKDSIEQYKKAGRDDLIAREEEQLKYVMEYLPEQMGREDVEKAVKKAIEEVRASGMGDMGKVMGAVMKDLQGKADGTLVSDIVKEKLS